MYILETTWNLERPRAQMSSWGYGERQGLQFLTPCVWQGSQEPRETDSPTALACLLLQGLCRPSPGGPSYLGLTGADS